MCQVSKQEMNFHMITQHSPCTHKEKRQHFHAKTTRDIFTYILEWGQGTCILSKHTRCWRYSALQYFFWTLSSKKRKKIDPPSPKYKSWTPSHLFSFCLPLHTHTHKIHAHEGVAYSACTILPLRPFLSGIQKIFSLIPFNPGMGYTLKEKFSSFR